MKTIAPVTIDIVLHPVQTKIIWAMREGLELEQETLRSIAECIRRNLKEPVESPQNIKHHLMQLVKLGIVNVINGKYVNNDLYAMRTHNLKKQI